MTTGFRTPLLDCFRRGDIARDIRLLAAKGALAPRAHEQLGLLILLVGDPDPEIAAAAEATIQAIPPGSLAAFLGRSDAPSEFRSFFAARGIEPERIEGDAGDGPLVETAGEDGAGLDPGVGGDAASADDDAVTSAVNRIAALGIAERLSLAMKGTREERAILVRDPNRLVAAAVLSSPKITESEIEAVSRMGTVSEDVLRIIANTRAWMKHYPVVVGLAKNPKTPIAVSMNLLARLNDRDLRTLASDRNIPDVLRLTARKKIAAP